MACKLPMERVPKPLGIIIAAAQAYFTDELSTGSLELGVRGPRSTVHGPRSRVRTMLSTFRTNSGRNRSRPNGRAPEFDLP